MHKIWLITKREYWTRVRSKAFILSTLLAPLGLIFFMGVMTFIVNKGSDTERKFVITDPNNILEGQMESNKNISYTFSTEDLSSLLRQYEKGDFDGVIEIPAITSGDSKKVNVSFYSDQQLAIDESMQISNKLEKSIRNYKITLLGLDNEKIDQLSTSVTLDPISVKDKGKEVTSMTAVVGSILGGVMSYIMFFIILIYGAQVMRSVMEEKINRIVEVLISSVKPYELMMGKIIGVGSVGLTQVGLWMIIIPIIAMLAKFLFGIDTSPAVQMSQEMPEEVGVVLNSQSDKIAQVFQELYAINWLKIAPLMVFYFLGGYFAYAALFAAVGSAIGEDINEAQSLTLPIMLPLILAVYIGVGAIQAPNNSLAVWSSIIPLLSSIVMPVRLPMDPPLWQLALSMGSLVVFGVFFVWLAARIYRVGILMYGKKASLKELGKWIFYKG